MREIGAPPPVPPRERTLAVTAIDYDATVTMMVHDRATLIPSLAKTTTLAEAVRIIVENWTEQQQAEIYLATEAGPITSLAEVQAIYSRPDFPRLVPASPELP